MIEFAYADNAATQAAVSPWGNMIPFVLMLAAMWFILIRPQQRAEKQRRQMVSQLKKGDRILLSSGFYGKVIQTGEHLVKVDLGKNLVVEVNPNAIAALANETQSDSAASAPKSDDPAA